MDLIHKILNVVAPLFTFLFLCFFYPLYLVFNFLRSMVAMSCFPESLAGKVVMVIGASSGLGESVAYAYAKKGARLAVVARRENALREVADKALKLGSPDCIVIPADVSVVEECKKIVDETMSHFGQLDHLVTSVAVGTYSMLEDIKNITDFRVVMDTNFWGVVYTTYYAIPHLRKRKGKILVMSSVNSWMPAPRNSIYNASKAAITTLFETLRVELRPDVQVTIATPGFIESEINKGKYMFDDGNVRVDPDAKEVQIGAMPVARAEGWVDNIVESVRRGDKYVTVPIWFGVTYWWKVLCPDVVEWCLALLYLTRRGAPPTHALTKNIIDFTRAQGFLYPPSIQNPQIKTH